MGGAIEKKFKKDSSEKAFDLDHRRIANFSISQYTAAAYPSFLQFRNLENAKRKAHLIKWRTMENLDKMLPEFETNFQKRGGKVIWANDASEALDAIKTILEQHGTTSVIKSKSMVTEEIGLNEFLENEGVHPVETDLGEYSIRLGTPVDADPATMTAEARKLLRGTFTTATVGITGANFLVADSGSVALTENEGNARLATTFPKVHIAIAGIEKLIPSLKDLDLFWPLLSTHGTGQQLTAYNSIISGPRKAGETDGPEEMYVILLDNGRTNLLAQPEQREGLYCIRCGACLNVCPVYQHIGGHSYGTTYSGPIGSLITPHTQGMADFKHLSEASTLCGKCTEVCPVRIDISRMLLLNRRDAVREGHHSRLEKTSWKAFRVLLGKRKLLDFVGGKFKNALLALFAGRKAGKHRALPRFSDKSFTKQWKSDQPQSRFPGEGSTH